MEKKLLEYFTLLKDFGRIYTRRIIDGDPQIKSDLKLSQIKALYAFRDQECLTMKELAASLDVKLPNMTMMVDSLEGDGIVERDRDGRDRRKVMVRLTEKGKEIRADFLERREEIAKAIFSRLNQADRRELLTSLASVCRILDKTVNEE